MKKIMALALLLSIGMIYGAGYYDKYAAQIKELQAKTTKTTKITAEANAEEALEKVEEVDLSKVEPKYVDIVTQLKDKTVPEIIKSIKIIAPKLVELATKTSAGGVTGFFQGAVSLAVDTPTRDAAISLVKSISDTIDNAKKIAGADLLTKQAVQNILAAVAANPDVAKVLSLAKEIPFVGQKLHDKLLDLIQLKF